MFLQLLISCTTVLVLIWAQGSDAAPHPKPQDSYGPPKAPPVDSYGPPQAEVIDTYGTPAAPPVTPPTCRTEKSATEIQGAQCYADPPQCVDKCITVYEPKCEIQYEAKCKEVQDTKCETKYQKECTTVYDEVCEEVPTYGYSAYAAPQKQCTKVT